MSVPNPLYIAVYMDISLFFLCKILCLLAGVRKEGVNEEGLNYYSLLLDELKANGFILYSTCIQDIN